jgi:hypothetical protein
MLRTNLATRPFYNERLVYLLMALAAIACLAVTIYNTTRIFTLSRRSTDLAMAAQRDEGRARDLERQAAAVRRDVSGPELESLAVAARQANALIDQRTFSWTELFNRIETTLPPDVMITSVRPDIQKEGVWLSMVVVGRRVEDIDAFMEKLETTGVFADLLSRQEEIMEDGMYKAVLQARYIAAKS